MSTDARWTVGTGIAVLTILVMLFGTLRADVRDLGDRLAEVEQAVAALAVQVVQLQRATGE